MLCKTRHILYSVRTNAFVYHAVIFAQQANPGPFSDFVDQTVTTAADLEPRAQKMLINSYSYMISHLHRCLL